MTVFKPESVNEQPIVEMSHWSIRTVTDNDGYTTVHLVGLVNGFGRVSSTVSQIYHDHTIRTSSGRIYKLIGESKHHMDAEWVWAAWLEANNAWEANNGPVSFDLERMKMSLEDPFYEIPQGLTTEEIREHILEKAKHIKEKNDE